MDPQEFERQYSGLRPEQLRDEVDRLDGLLRPLHRNLRTLNAKQRDEFDVMLECREWLVERIEEHENARRSYARGGNRVVSAYHGLGGDDDFYGGDVQRMSAKEVRSLARRALSLSGKRLKPDEGDRVEKLIGDERGDDDEAYIARRILLTENPAYRSAWKQLMTEVHPLLNNEEIESIRAFQKFERAETRAMSEGTPSAGGYGIPVFIDPSIILTAQGSDNPFLTLAKQVEINTNAWKGVTSAGVTWSFQAEGATVADGSPTLGQPVVQVWMARGFLPFTIELGMDYPGFAEEMATLLAAGYDELLVDKFSRGSGSTEPWGIITALDADTNAEVRLTTAGAFGDIDIYNVWAKLPQRFRRKASWMMSVATNNAIRRMGTSSLSHAYTTNLVGETIDKLYNKAVVESTYFPDVVNTTGAFNQLVVGDFSNYIVARRGGMNMELIPHLFDVTSNRPVAQRGYFAYSRVGGNVAQTTAFRLLNQT